MNQQGQNNVEEAPSRVTINAIAKRLGVSRMTVARALNGDPRKRAKAKHRVEQVLQISREMGYRCNTAARAMSLGRLNTIGIVQCGDGPESYLPSERMNGIQHALAELKMGVMVSRVDVNKLEDSSFVPEILRNLSADGLLMDVIRSNSPRMVNLIDEYNVPATWINVKHTHDVVRPDDLGAGVQATKILLDLGHRRIEFWDFCVRDQRHYSWADRFEGYQQAMTKAGLLPKLLQTQFFDEEERHTTAMQLLQNHDRPTAIIADNMGDVIAICTAAKWLRLRIPADLSVFSFQEYSEVTRCLRLSIMEQPDYAVGELAVKMLVNKIENPLMKYEPVLVPFGFKDSGSIGPP
ncbi:MAG: LacI family transcriptional regulator [Phycisphaerales bacterium]|nr:LacI family transcriptional regulator [Phycisphaerales bacterium]